MEEHCSDMQSSISFGKLPFYIKEGQPILYQRTASKLLALPTCLVYRGVPSDSYSLLT